MTNVQVEVDLYSGRENPRWDLGEAETALFRTRLADLLPAGAGVSSVPDGLGYRGLHVAIRTDGATRHLRIAAGVVIVESATGAERRSLRDPGRGLEKWLLRTGKEHLGAELLRYLLGE